ncbi:MAG: hypothetical protein ACXAC2_14460 [Candidatus Kariarchaeaceae archaeon]|jgi:hypothetical protein
MKPQRPQRNTLRTLKEFPFKDISEKIIYCATEIHSPPGTDRLKKLEEE